MAYLPCVVGKESEHHVLQLLLLLHLSSSSCSSCLSCLSSSQLCSSILDSHIHHSDLQQEITIHKLDKLFKPDHQKFNKIGFAS